MVGTARFELATSWSRTRRTTKLCYVPLTKVLAFASDNVITLVSLLKERHLVAFAQSVKRTKFS